MRDYHNYFLITDILLLADEFENFRKMSMKTFGLDPYYSLLCLSWDAMLKYTDVVLDLIADTDMYQMMDVCMSVMKVCVEVSVISVIGMLLRIIPIWIRTMINKN